MQYFMYYPKVSPNLSNQEYFTKMLRNAGLGKMVNVNSKC